MVHYESRIKLVNYFPNIRGKFLTRFEFIVIWIQEIYKYIRENTSKRSQSRLLLTFFGLIWCSRATFTFTILLKGPAAPSLVPLNLVFHVAPRSLLWEDSGL